MLSVERPAELVFTRAATRIVTVKSWQGVRGGVYWKYFQPKSAAQTNQNVIRKSKYTRGPEKVEYDCLTFWRRAIQLYA